MKKPKRDKPLRLISDADIRRHIVEVTRVNFKSPNPDPEIYDKLLEVAFAKAGKSRFVTGVDEKGFIISKPGPALEYMLDHGLISMGEIRRAVSIQGTVERGDRAVS